MWLQTHISASAPQPLTAAHGVYAGIGDCEHEHPGTTGTQTPTQGTVGAKTCTQRRRKIMTRVGCHIPSAATSYPVAQITPKPQACEVPQDRGCSVLHVGTGPPVPSAALSEQRLRHCGHSLGRGGINTDLAGAAPRLPSFPGISTSLPLSLFSASPSPLPAPFCTPNLSGCHRTSTANFPH